MTFVKINITVQANYRHYNDVNTLKSPMTYTSPYCHYVRDQETGYNWTTHITSRTIDLMWCNPP